MYTYKQPISRTGRVRGVLRNREQMISKARLSGGPSGLHIVAQMMPCGVDSLVEGHTQATVALSEGALNVCVCVYVCVCVCVCVYVCVCVCTSWHK